MRLGRYAARGRWARSLLVAALVALAVASMAAAAGTTSAAGPARGNGLCEIVQVVVPIPCDETGGRASAPAETDSPEQTGRTAESQPPAATAGVERDRVRQTSPVPRYDPRRLAVTFRRGTSRRTVAAVLARAGVVLEREIPQIRAYMVGVEPEDAPAALDSLQASPAVESAEREVILEGQDVDPNDAGWPRQWGLRLAGFPRAWEVTQGSSEVVVAVLDTGVDSGAADLRGALVAGYDFINSDPDPSDDDGHGTSVAGIVGARSDNREGGAGVCSRCSIMPVKVLDAAGLGDTSVVAAGIVWAVDHGARVINLSLGGPDTTDDLDRAVDYAVRNGTLVAAAAGNSGLSLPFYPAAAPGAVGVAGTTAADQPYPWTNFGAWVPVAAPGCNVAPLLGRGYDGFCGTSSATPIVSGLAALAFSARPAATPDDVEQALERAAVPLPGVVAYGRIDAPKTLSLLRPTSPPSAPQRATTVYRGSLGAAAIRSYTVRVGAGPLTATLAFAGAPTLTLTLGATNPGRPIARTTGRSPLRLSQTLAPGTTRITIRGNRKAAATYTLRVSYVTPPAG